MRCRSRLDRNPEHEKHGSDERQDDVDDDCNANDDGGGQEKAVE